MQFAPCNWVMLDIGGVWMVALWCSASLRAVSEDGQPLPLFQSSPSAPCIPCLGSFYLFIYLLFNQVSVQSPH